MTPACLERSSDCWRQTISMSVFSKARKPFLTVNPGDAGCLVIDIDLGGMSGIELKRKLVRSGISVPVIFITGKDSESVRKAAIGVAASHICQNHSRPGN